MNNYCDLNIQCRDFKTIDQDRELCKLISSSICDGYYTFAINYEQLDLQQQIKPCFWKQVNLDQVNLDVKQSNNLLKDLPKLDKVQQYTRITIEINEPRHLSLLHENGSKQLSTYDLIAVKTKNEKIFHSLCTEQDNFDIITFDISEQIPFTLKKAQMVEAVKKGLTVELCYSQAISDQDQKKTILANWIDVVKATRGKNLIISSQAQNYIYHRSPYDIIAMYIIETLC